jgi:very-short-patch-repair endonuclease
MRVPSTKAARRLRREQTDAEGKLWSRLRNRQVDGWRFKRQVPRGPYIVDFYCADAGLVVEVDGAQHLEERAEHDRRRTAYLEAQGLSVIRFWNRDVLVDIDVTIEAIHRALGMRPAPSPGAWVERRRSILCADLSPRGEVKRAASAAANRRRSVGGEVGA